jgi:hypothetical protein
MLGYGSGAKPLAALRAPKASNYIGKQSVPPRYVGEQVRGSFPLVAAAVARQTNPVLSKMIRQLYNFEWPGHGHYCT